MFGKIRHTRDKIFGKDFERALRDLSGEGQEARSKAGIQIYK